MQLADFDYHLPEELIAQEALADRGAARMLVVYRDEGRWEELAKTLETYASEATIKNVKRRTGVPM